MGPQSPSKASVLFPLSVGFQTPLQSYTLPLKVKYSETMTYLDLDKFYHNSLTLNFSLKKKRKYMDFPWIMGGDTLYIKCTTSITTMLRGSSRAHSQTRHVQDRLVSGFCCRSAMVCHNRSKRVKLEGSSWPGGKKYGEMNWKGELVVVERKARTSLQGLVI